MISLIIRDLITPRNNKFYLDWNSCYQCLHSKKWQEISTIENSDVIVRLEGIQFINLEGLIWLLLIGEFLRRRKNYLVLTLPKDNKSILQYMKAVDFDQIAKTVFEISPMFYFDDIKEYKRKKGVSIKKISNLNYHMIRREIGDFVNDGFAGMIGVRPGDQIFEEYVKPLLLPVIWELINNVVEHSGEMLNTGMGYVSFFLSGRNINIVIADIGIGFIKGLARRSLTVKSDFEAIRKALLFKYYRRDMDVEGNGIFAVLKALRKLGGKVKIGSGESQGVLDMGRGRLYKEESEDDLIKKWVENQLVLKKRSYFPGVQYSILINLESG